MVYFPFLKLFKDFTTFLGASLEAQIIKNLPAMWETPV